MLLKSSISRLSSQSFPNFFNLCSILDVLDEIANNFDLIGIVIRDLDVKEFIFDQYHQLQTIEPVDPEIVTEVRFIYNPLESIPRYSPIKVRNWSG